MSLKVVLMTVVITALAIMSAWAQPYELEFTVDDVQACPEDTLVYIDVYLANHFDTVAGFSFWIQLDRPDIIQFTTEVDTVVDTTYWECQEWSGPDCIDSVQVWPYQDWDFSHIDTHEVSISPIDTTGSLISGWEYVSANSLSGTGFDIKVVAIADMPNPPVTPALAEQPGGRLVRLIARILEPPPVVEDSTANLLVRTEMLEDFGFSDPQGNLLGTKWISTNDTTCWVCGQWVDDVCIHWVVANPPPPEGCDSIEVVVDSVMVLDTTAFLVEGGSATLVNPGFGDFDYSGEGPNIADLVMLVTFMFGGGPSPVCLSTTDCDENGIGPNIADLVCWVNWMFSPE
jgi:hypothetical protein